MSKESTDKAQDSKAKVDKMSTGGHLGGTNFGQVPGDAKMKDDREGGDKARPNDGSN